MKLITPKRVDLGISDRSEKQRLVNQGSHEHRFEWYYYGQ